MGFQLLLGGAVVQEAGVGEVADGGCDLAEAVDALLLDEVFEAVLVCQVLVGRVDAELVDSQVLGGGGAGGGLSD